APARRGSPPRTHEPVRLHVRAALPRARRARRGRVLALGAPGAAGAMAGLVVRRRALPRRGAAQLAARDARGPLPAPDAPAPERADRRRRAALSAARPHARAARVAAPARRLPPARTLRPSRVV